MEQHTAPTRRHVQAWRFLQFVLLLLAVLGYAGLPSTPSNGLQIAAALSDETEAAPSAPHKFSAPQQEQEYRSRDTQLPDAHDDTDPIVTFDGPVQANVFTQAVPPLSGSLQPAEFAIHVRARAPPLPLSLCASFATYRCSSRPVNVFGSDHI